MGRGGGQRLSGISFFIHLSFSPLHQKTLWVKYTCQTTYSCTKIIAVSKSWMEPGKKAIGSDDSTLQHCSQAFLKHWKPGWSHETREQGCMVINTSTVVTFVKCECVTMFQCSTVHLAWHSIHKSLTERLMITSYSWALREMIIKCMVELEEATTLQFRTMQ